MRRNVLRYRDEPLRKRPSASQVKVYRVDEDGNLIPVRTDYVRWDSSAKCDGGNFSRGEYHPEAAFKVVGTVYADETEIPSANG